MDLEQLISPLLKKICEYCAFKDGGCEVPQDVMLSEIRSDLNLIRQKAAAYPVLAQQYQVVEKPLVFFIDYIIKEGGFSFSGSYRELARNFNELSGDDKFFDLLDEAVKTNEDQEIIRVFYLLIGLGFDGYYKRRRAEIVELMQKTSALLPKAADFNIQKITPDIVAEEHKVRDGARWYQKPRSWLIAALALTLVAFLVNLAALSSSVSGFTHAVEEASHASIQGYEADTNTSSGGISDEFGRAIEQDQAKGGAH